MKIGYGVAGYPAAGKSVVGEKLEQLLGGINIETGNVVRREASKHFDCDVEQLSSKELGEYSTMRRETDGGDYVAQDVIEQLEDNPDFPERPVIVTGMRDSEVPELFNEYFDHFQLVFVDASEGIRLERLRGRGRQDESDFTREDLRERDEREAEWGTADLHDKADTHIINEGTVDELVDKLQEKVVLERPTLAR